MSLVVARRFPIGVRLEADTRITDPHATHTGYLTGALKIVVVHPDLCVGFAGNANRAIGAIADLPVRRDAELDLEAVMSRLLIDHEEGERSVDFLLGHRDPPEVICIRDGEVRRGLQSAWIGDHAAFAAYQEAFHAFRSSFPFPQEIDLPAHLSPDVLRTKAAMGQAMDAVVQHPDVTTVDDLVIAADVFDDAGFTYAPAAAMYKGKDQAIPPNRWTTITFEGAVEGGFAFSILVPKRAGIGAVGVHFFQGRFGLLLFPQRSLEPVRITEVDHRGFVAEVQRRFGFELSGPVIS